VSGVNLLDQKTLTRNEASALRPDLSILEFLLESFGEARSSSGVVGVGIAYRSVCEELAVLLPSFWVSEAAAIDVGQIIRVRISEISSVRSDAHTILRHTDFLVGSTGWQVDPHIDDAIILVIARSNTTLEIVEHALADLRKLLERIESQITERIDEWASCGLAGIERISDFVDHARKVFHMESVILWAIGNSATAHDQQSDDPYLEMFASGGLSSQLSTISAGIGRNSFVGRVMENSLTYENPLKAERTASPGTVKKEGWSSGFGISCSVLGVPMGAVTMFWQHPPTEDSIFLDRAERIARSFEPIVIRRYMARDAEDAVSRLSESADWVSGGKAAMELMHDIVPMWATMRSAIDKLLPRINPTNDTETVLKSHLVAIPPVIGKMIAIIDRQPTEREGMTEPKPSKVDLFALSDEVKAVLEERTSQARIEVSVSKSAAFVDTVDVLIPESHALRIIYNLLSNSIHFLSPRNKYVSRRARTISIVFKLIDSEIAMSVEDNGPGIADESKNRIFDLYYTQKGRFGTGIGLHAAKRLVERWGGTIVETGDHSVGAKFVIVFPRYKTRRTT